MEKLRNSIILNLCGLSAIFRIITGMAGTGELYEEGKFVPLVYLIFILTCLVDICSFSRIKPMVNQVEVHPFYQQEKAKKWMDKYSVQIEAGLRSAKAEGICFRILC